MRLITEWVMEQDEPTRMAANIRFMVESRYRDFEEWIKRGEEGGDTPLSGDDCPGGNSDYFPDHFSGQIVQGISMVFRSSVNSANEAGDFGTLGSEVRVSLPDHLEGKTSIDVPQCSSRPWVIQGLFYCQPPTHLPILINLIKYIFFILHAKAEFGIYLIKSRGW